MAREEKKDLKKEIDKAAKLFDVAKPGKSAPTTTSRPIIVGHAPMMKRDPMMRDSADVEKEQIEQETSTEVAKTPVIVKSHEKRLNPLPAETETETVVAVKSDEKEVDAPDSPEIEPEPTQKRDSDEPETAKIIPDPPNEEEQSANEPSEPEEDSASDPDTAADSNSKAAVDSLVNEVSAKQADKKAQQDLDAKVAEIEASIQKKEYFVPIGQVSRRRSNRILIILLIVVLLVAVVGVNLAIDAGMLDVGVEPLTDIL